jgi:hypothetical protein
MCILSDQNFNTLSERLDVDCEPFAGCDGRQLAGQGQQGEVEARFVSFRLLSAR